ncbi:MAG: hypothetical protein HY926_15515 [Elusimicrobia bacterium]|nr:hypothetical protein [Elusimicrobiota bacterium]
MRNSAFALAVLLSLISGAQAAQWQDATSIKDILKQAAEQGSEMPNLQGRAEGPTIYAYERAPMGFTSKTFQGNLKLSPGKAVALKAVSGAPMTLADGPVKLVYGKPGASDFFTRARSVSLTQGSATAAFPARSPEFDSFGAFSTSPAGEDYMLKGTQTVKQTGQYERQGTDSCTYSGFCYASGLNSKGEFSYSYGFHVSCSGSRDVLHQITQYETTKTVALISLQEQAIVGVITGAPEASQKVRTIKDLSSCR